MQTEYLRLDVSNKYAPELYRAEELLSASEIVAFPTETVYGLGAKAFDEAAVEKIFIAKNRPSGQPLLVHISAVEQVYDIVSEITEDAQKLMEMFWPGPLSMILKANAKLPLAVTGGKETVGMRMPSNSAARHLIDIAGPIAATSANLSGRPSPLTAEHVKEDLDGRIAAILDGGPTGLGIESTLIDLSQEPYSILRLGGVPVQDLENALGKRLVFNKADMKKTSYQTDLMVIVADDWEDFYRQFEKFRHKSLGIVSYDNKRKQNIINDNIKEHYNLILNQSGSMFFSLLRDAEQKKIELLIFTPLPDTINASLKDRINRAACTFQQGDQ